MQEVFSKSNENTKSQGVVFEEFFNKHYQTFCCFAYSFVKDKEASEDIVQERFAKLWQQSIDFSHPLQVKSWMYKAVRNASLDWLKSQTTISKKHNGLAYLNSLETEDFKLQQIIRAEVLEEIFAVIDTLPPGCKRTFTMFYLEGKSLQKISKELNLSINTIKSQKAKGLSVLRQKLPPLSFLIALAFFENFN